MLAEPEESGSALAAFDDREEVGGGPWGTSTRSMAMPRWAAKARRKLTLVLGVEVVVLVAAGIVDVDGQLAGLEAG